VAARKKASRKRGTTRKTAAKGSSPRRKTGARRKATGSGGAASSSAPAAKDEAPLAEIEALAVLMERHELVEVRYSARPDGTRKIHARRAGDVTLPAMMPAGMPAPAPPAPAAPAPAAPAGGAPVESGTVAFKSPMVGTFYRAPSPEGQPFVSIGDMVDPSTVVCIIEAMKVMNEISPDVSGEIVSIEVENGEAVEFGQTLMLIRPR
jgi:acetyl-CoA carboxylase biotin carboxyl carrier protein